MMKVLILCLIIICIIHESRENDNLLAEGCWMIRSVHRCDDYSNYKNNLTLTKSKYNRSMDMFDIKFELDEEITSTHGIYMSSCKFVDGGCKPYHELSDSSVENFAKKYSGENYNKFLSMIKPKLKEPKLPIGKGCSEVKGMIVNYKELPKDGPIGEYIVHAYITRGIFKIGCAKLHTAFMEKSECNFEESEEE